MGKNINIISNTKSMGSLAVALVFTFLVSGCGFIENFKTEAEEEKKILGYVQNYNPRIKDMESLLKDEGFDPGQVDGIMDKKTRAAIRNFQKANKLKETGYINTATRAKVDLLGIEKTVKRQSPPARQSKSAINISYPIRKGQEALRKSGFNPGPIDGRIGDKTRRAIRCFQRSRGLVVDGTFNQKTWEILSEYLPEGQLK